MIKIFKGNIIIGDPALIGIDNLKDSIIEKTGTKDIKGIIHWAPESVTDLKYYKKRLDTITDQELGDFTIDSGFLCIGLWKKNTRPKDNGTIYLTNYEGPVEIWQDEKEISHVLGYGNIRFYSQWKSI